MTPTPYPPDIDAITTRRPSARKVAAGQQAAQRNHDTAQEHYRLLREDKARREAEADAVIAQALAAVGECKGGGDNVTLVVEKRTGSGITLHRYGGEEALCRMAGVPSKCGSKGGSGS